MAVNDKMIEFPIQILHDCKEDSHYSFNIKNSEINTSIHSCRFFTKNFGELTVEVGIETIVEVDDMEIKSNRDKIYQIIGENINDINDKDLFTSFRIPDGFIEISIDIFGGFCPKAKDFKEGIVNLTRWLESNDYRTKYMDYILLKGENEYEFTINYPLTQSFSTKFKITDLTFCQLVDKLVYSYEQIYKEEKESLTQQDKESLAIHSKEIEDKIITLMNRPITNGKWGIRGHEMSDLCLEAIRYNSLTQRFYFSIGS